MESGGERGREGERERERERELIPDGERFLNRGSASRGWRKEEGALKWRTGDVDDCRWRGI